MICDRFDKCLSLTQEKIGERCIECRKISNDSNITCEEKGRRYNLQNDKKLDVINFLIDGGVYDKESQSKCDRLYYVFDKPKSSAIFIELKGKDVKHALEQLMVTVSTHKELFANDRKYFRIVCSGVPKIANDKKCIKIKEILLKNFNSIPLIRERVINEKYSVMVSEDN